MKYLLIVLLIFTLAYPVNAAYRPYNDEPYLLRVAKREILGVDGWTIRANTDGATIGDTYKDVWNRAGTGDMVYPTTATTASFVSDDAQDAATGTGTYQILVFGLDENKEIAVEVVPLTGSTPSVTTSLWWRIYKIQAYTYGSGNTTGTIANGAITCTVDSKIVAGIIEDETSSAMTHFTTPSNAKSYIMSYQVSSDNKESARMELVTRISPAHAWVVKLEAEVSEQNVPIILAIPFEIYSNADIRWRAKKTGSNNIAPSITYQIITIEN